MQPQRSSLVAEYRLQSRFEETRDRLLRSERGDRLQQPLAYWALPHDRRLPLAFMSRSVQDLLRTPFDELSRTPGVGQKKMVALVHLLERAESGLGDEHVAFPIDEALAALAGPEAPIALEDGFSSDHVSEAAWSQWRDSVRRYHLEEETLGRFAPSLERLPRVLWHTPLNAYCDLSLSQIRELKTHGEKRVSAVLEVFHELYALLSGLGSMSNLAIRIQPRLAGQVENWLLAVLERSELPQPAELDRQLLMPLAAQVRSDLGELVGDLIDDRLGLSGHETTVRERAASLGLTRARLYQLLADAAEVIAVRWPEGQYLTLHLASKIRERASDQDAYDRFFAAVDLFFPARRPTPAETPTHAAGIQEIIVERVEKTRGESRTFLLPSGPALLYDSGAGRLMVWGERRCFHSRSRLAYSILPDFWRYSLVIVGLVFVAVLTRYFRLYIQSITSGAGIGLLDLWGMTFRKINPAVIVRSKIMAVQAGLGEQTGITSKALEAHYLAGGNVPQVIKAIIAANKAKTIDLDFKLATAIDLAGRSVLEAVQTSVYPKVIDCPGASSARDTLDAVAKNGIQLKVKARVTVRANLLQLIGGATEETIIARVGEGIVSAIGSADTHTQVLENPDRISKAVLAQRLDSQTAFEIVSIDIADIDVGDNIGARLQADQAEADTRVAQAKAESRRAMAVAREQEMIASIEESRAKLVEAEAEVPRAIAEAFQSGSIGILDYYKLRNVQADTEMRSSLATSTSMRTGKAGERAS